MALTREQLKLVVEQRKAKEKAERDAAVKALVAAQSGSFERVADETLQRLAKEQKQICKDAKKEAATAKKDTQAALDKKQVSDQGKKSALQLKAQDVELKASQARIELAQEIKESDKVRRDEFSLLRKKARREEKRKLLEKKYAREKYEFRIMTLSQVKRTLPLGRQPVYLNTQDFAHTLVTIDIYEKDGYIAYRLVAPDIQIAHHITSMRMPLLETEWTIYPYEREHRETFQLSPEKAFLRAFNPGRMAELKRLLSNTMSEHYVDLAEYSPYIQTDYVEANYPRHKKTLYIYKKDDFIACAFSFNIVDRTTSLKAPKPFVLDELLKEQILYAISQEGLLKRQSPEKKRRAKLEALSLENRLREHQEKKLKNEQEQKLKWEMEIELGRRESKFNSENQVNALNPASQRISGLLTLCLEYQEHFSEGCLGCLGSALLYIFCWDNSGKRNIIDRLTGILQRNDLEDVQKLDRFTAEFTAETEAILAPRRTRWFWSLFCPASSTSHGVDFANNVKELLPRKYDFQARAEAKTDDQITRPEPISLSGWVGKAEPNSVQAGSKQPSCDVDAETANSLRSKYF